MLTAPFTAAKVLHLQATVVVLLMLLMKSQLLRVKMSFLGSVIGPVLLLNFLAATGLLSLVAGGSLLYAFSRSPQATKRP